MASKKYAFFAVLLIISILGLVPLAASQGNWEQVQKFEIANNRKAFVTVVHKGRLYAGTDNIAGAGGELWRTLDGTTWTNDTTAGFGVPENIAIWADASYDGYLYGSTWAWGATGSLWRSTNGADWSPVSTDGFGDSKNISLEANTVFDGYLYAGTVNEDGGQVWRYSPDTTWTQVNSNGFGDSRNRGAIPRAVFKGHIYVPTGNPSAVGQLWRSPGGTTWTTATINGFGNQNNSAITKLGSLNGYLYAGTSNEIDGAEVWRTYDGITWDPVASGGFDDINNAVISSLSAFDGYLYAGTFNNSTGAEVWRYSEDTTWTQINENGFGDLDNFQTHGTFVEFYDAIYVGVDNFVSGAEVRRLDIGTAGNTAASNTTVTVEPEPGVQLEFNTVTDGGDTTVTRSATSTAGPPSGFMFRGNQLDISTSAGYTSPIRVTISYDEAGMNEEAQEQLKLFHYDGSIWVDVTVSVDTVNNTITGQVDSLSPFIVGERVVTATLDIDPGTLNKKSKGAYITAYIGLPEGHGVNDVNLSTITLHGPDGDVGAEMFPVDLEDSDGDGVPEYLMVKFDRYSVQGIVGEPGDVELTMTFRLHDGTACEGTDAIKVIDKGKVHVDSSDPASIEY